MLCCGPCCSSAFSDTGSRRRLDSLLSTCRSWQSLLRAHPGTALTAALRVFAYSSFAQQSVHQNPSSAHAMHQMLACRANRHRRTKIGATWAGACLWETQ
jgi:hypothetical protein